MPGEIGASIFSPRPARGYRFQSLQVEIIFLAPSQLQKPQSYSLNFQFGGGHFAPQSECLTTKILPEVVNQINISRMLQMAADIAGQLTAIMASVAVLSRHRH
jgi:hypothetical protein